MAINFKKELELASKGMIKINDLNLLLKLLVRMLVSKFHVKHASVLLFEPEKNAYVLSAFRGQKEFSIPEEFSHLNEKNPLIKFFRNKEFKSLVFERNVLVADDINRMIWRESIIEYGDGTKELLNKMAVQMKVLNSFVCVPSYYKNQLMAVLLLGQKQDESSFEQAELDFFLALASDAAMAIRNAQLFRQLKKEINRNRQQYIQTIIVLSSTMEAKDAYTHGHTERVTGYAQSIAQKMAEEFESEFPDNFFENLYISSLLHDIGKIGVPEAILNKNGKLTDKEYEVMMQHTIKGVEIVKPLTLPQECLGGIMSHHERYDGGGYPEGLKKQEIPIFASIIAVADAFDAMTSDRPYRKGRSQEKAIEEIKNNSGSQFDPKVVNTFLEIYENAGELEEAFS